MTAGRTNAVLAIERGSDGELTFTLYTNDAATGRTAQLIQQAANAVSVADRLDRLGVAPADQAALFGPATYVVKWPDPARTEPTQDSAAMGSSYLLAFGITLLIFMMIVLYGNWVAMSVVEEKSSRVMEVILNAATPFELLGGKVLGVGAAAALQYLAILRRRRSRTRPPGPRRVPRPRRAARGSRCRRDSPSPSSSCSASTESSGSSCMPSSTPLLGPW